MADEPMKDQEMEHTGTGDAPGAHRDETTETLPPDVARRQQEEAEARHGMESPENRA